MKKPLSVMIFLVVSVLIFSSVLTPINQLKYMKDLTTVTIEGIVTVEPGPYENNIFFVQDKTGGVNIYSEGIDISNYGIKRGQSVRVSGYVWTHKMNTEVVVNTSNSNFYIEILSHDQTELLPRLISTNEVNDNKNEGDLVKIKGKITRIVPPEVYVNDGSGEALVYIRENTGIDVSFFKENIDFECVGVLGQYLTKHELWPRSIEDITTSDIIPPVHLLSSLKDEHTVSILFSEPLKQIPAESFRVQSNQVVSISYSFSDRIVTIKTQNPIINQKIFIRGLEDMNNNLVNLYTVYIDSKKDSKEKKVLFDESHGQKSGNADWIAEGGYSDFADALKAEGFTIFSLKEDFSADILNIIGVAVIPEPNKPYKSGELRSITDYVFNGGGIFLIADHGGADRNGDGWDAVRILNELTLQMGFYFNGDDLYEAPLAKVVQGHPVTSNVEKIGVWNGSSITIKENSSILPLVFDSQAKIFVLTGSFGNGTFVAIGDSSPFDDGSGTSGKILHDGWHWGDDAVFAVNTVKYLSDSSISVK